MDLGSQLPPVWASPAQLRQIVMNLVTNASDAIGDREGLVRVTTRLVTPDLSRTLGTGARERDYLQLEVSDTGRGISPEMQTKIFDPFFTTRGAGHGLGLAVVQGIVRSLQGTIHMTSQLGHGTTFQVILPCTGGAAAGLTSISVASESPERAQPFVVLVVEDEDPLRHAVVAMLERARFSVIDAADGTIAIELLRAHRRKIDVVLLDMTIPGASSHDVMLEAAHTRPGTRVILTSAYSKEMLKPAMTSSQIHGFIRKPYRLGDLVQTLRSAASA
jgi:CheY-like chemotaxis protein